MSDKNLRTKSICFSYVSIKKIKDIAVILIMALAILLTGCGKKKWNYIDGVACFCASNTEYASVERSDPAVFWKLC